MPGLGQDPSARFLGLTPFNCSFSRTDPFHYEQKPVQEMLYDLEKDPDQLKNLAKDPEYASVLKRMRARTDELTEKYTRD